MIYIVAGYARSGTRMMMECMEAGGLPLHHDAANGMLEPSREAVYTLGWPRRFDGHAIKLLYRNLEPTLESLAVRLAVHEPGYRVVMMWRDPLEIKASFESRFANGSHLSIPWLARPGLYHQALGLLGEHLRNRRDVESVTDMNYRDVLANPFKELSRLEVAGWPLDVEKAASVVDESLCHFRREEIEGAA